jgi:hypothetical protein
MDHSERRSPYDVLGVGPSATQQEIKEAYRKLCKQYHPDLATQRSAQSLMSGMHAQDLEVNQKHYERTFKEISAAYAALTKRGSGVSPSHYYHEGYRQAYQHSGNARMKFSNSALALVLTVPLVLVGFMVERKKDQMEIEAGGEMKIRPGGFWVPPYNPYLRDDLRPTTRERKWW